jgi:hypothetical protein
VTFVLGCDGYRCLHKKQNVSLTGVTVYFCDFTEKVIKISATFPVKNVSKMKEVFHQGPPLENLECSTSGMNMYFQERNFVQIPLVVQLQLTPCGSKNMISTSQHLLELGLPTK